MRSERAAPKFAWTTNRALAAAALVLGVAALAGNPYHGHTVTMNTQDLATIVASKVDHVTATELADWIIQNRSDYRLIDVREPAEFAADHIPTAENVPITDLPDAGLGRNEKIVLVSEGGIHSAQAWMLLRAQKYTGVYILFGGLDAWKDEVVFPVAPANPGPKRRVRSARRAGEPLLRWCAARGRLRLGSRRPARGRVAPSTPAPTAAKAPPPPAASKSAPPKKKKEGC